MTCTFKNDKAPTRLAKVGWRQGCDINYKKQLCGRIDAPSHWMKESNYRIHLMVIDADTWKWVTLKDTFTSLDEAKEWTKANFPTIMAKFQLRFTERQV